MSHEALSQLWSTLSDLHSLSAALRDAVGNFILQACRSEYHQLETPQRFLEYALELGAAFDVTRYLARVDRQPLPSLQEDLVAAVSHFLLQTANDFGTCKSLLTDPGYIHVLGQTLCSAVCTLRLCAWNCRPDLRTALHRASNKVLTNAPATDVRLWFIQSLAHFLSSHYGPNNPIHSGFDRSEIDWRMLWAGNTEQRMLSISELVERATDTDIATMERILPLLELCQLYWDTDALVIQAGAHGPRHKHFSKFFHVPDDLTAVQLALEVRFAIQEQLTTVAIHRTAAHDSLKTQTHVLFRPGLSLACCQDLCNCSFHPRLSEQILGMRYRLQSDVVRADIANIYANSAIAQFPAEYFNRVYRRYEDRLKRPNVPEPISSDEPSPQTSSRQNPPTTNVSDERQADGKDVTAPLQSVSHPENQSHYLRPQPLIENNSNANATFSNRAASKERIVNGEVGETSLMTLNANEDNSISTSPRVPPLPMKRIAPPSVNLPSPGPQTPDFLKIGNRPRNFSVDHESTAQSPGSQSRSPASAAPLSPNALARTDSCTTATSSSRPNTQSADSYVKTVRSYAERIQEETFPEALSKTATPLMPSLPADYDKVYPEVVTTAITDVEPDGLSFFSDENSGPVTARSVYTPSNKKWNLFKSTRRANSPFVTPKVHFFASGRHIIAWNKYGAGIYDLCNEESLFSPIHIPDIVLASAGTTRYTLVTRSQEGFIIIIYALNQAAPVSRLSSKPQPTAIDVSRDDRYVAVKYAHVVKIIDLHNGSSVSHALPRDEGKIGPCGHYVAFAHDSTSFMASTRLGPEKVSTYWSYCMDPSRAVTVQSSAPCGHVDDHGLTSINVCGPSVRSVATAFLTTFTEKGAPTVLAMNQNSPARAKPIPDTKGLVGTRIHHAAMYVDVQTKKAYVALVNQSNDVFWITNVFGSDQDIKKVRSLKRPKGMKPEVLVSMTNAEEANIFWIEKGSNVGILVKVGKGGGMTKPVELRLDCEPMCAA